MPTLYQKTLARLRQYAQSKGSISALADNLGAKRSVFHKVFSGKQTYAKTYLDWLEKLGVQIIFPDDKVFTTPRPVQISCSSADSNHESCPSDHNYIAVPLVNRSELVRDIRSFEVQDWVIIRPGDGLKDRAHLAVLQIGIEESSMSPLLCPGDFALVNFNDNIPQKPPGNIYLVQTPDKEDLIIRRVQIQKRNGESVVIFYSDNPMYVPESCKVEADYDGDIQKTILGRVVWSWTDMTQK